jgi:hypothetical protein
MSEEVKPAEQGQQSTSAPAAETAQTQVPQTEGLEDVYKRFNVEAEASNFQARPAQRESQPEAPHRVEQQEEINIPDPTLQPNEYKAYELRKAKEQQFSKQALQQLDGKLNGILRATVKAQEEADIRGAVSEINEHLGSNKLDPDEVEIRLGTKARKDPRFMSLWQNRNKNPAALKAALKAIAGEIGKKTEYRVDPQIAENQRALKEATSTKATTAPEETLDTKLGKLSPAKFQRAMAQIRQGLTPTFD